jgi:sulfur-oxidizing protein SoxZ
VGRLYPGPRHAQRVRMMTNHIGEARIKVPDRIKRGDLITVHSIVSHPMDTGFFRSADGAPIPAYFIKQVVVTYGTEEVARFEWTSGISKDPVVSFTLKADREAPLTMVWTDNQGATFKQSINISFVSA